MGRALKISTTLHEIGHFIDFHKNKHEHFYSRQALNASQAIHEGKSVSKRQKALIMRSEVLAWREGEALARALGIRLGRWFYVDKEASLNSYRPHVVKP